MKFAWQHICNFIHGKTRFVCKIVDAWPVLNQTTKRSYKESQGNAKPVNTWFFTEKFVGLYIT